MTLYGTLDDDFPHSDAISARETVEALPKLAQGGQPWMAYCGFNGPHDPYRMYQKYLDQYDIDDVPLPASYGDELTDKPRIYQRMRQMRFGQLSEREVREAIRHFWAYCTYLDDLFGQILDALEATGQAENTVVLYCSDHGDYVGEHGLFAKGIPCFRGAYNVPAVVRWPAGLADPGRRVDAFVSLADFAPTFLDLAGVETDRHFTGRSLRPWLEGKTPAEWRDAIFTQCNGVELYYTQRSVTTRDWTYTFNGFDRDELYDLRNDPDQMHNLADKPEHRETIRQMCKRMWQFACDEGDTATNAYITVGLAPFGPGEAFRE